MCITKCHRSISGEAAFSSALRTGARYECVPATLGASVVSLELMKGLTMRRTIAHMNPTSGRSTPYGSGHLVRVFRDIGRIVSSLARFIEVLFLSRFDPVQGFVTSRQTFVRRCHRGIVPCPGLIDAPARRLNGGDSITARWRLN